MIMGGEFDIIDYFVWNEIPTALGNLVGGFLLVGLPLYYTHVRESKSKKTAQAEAESDKTVTAM